MKKIISPALLLLTLLTAGCHVVIEEDVPSIPVQQQGSQIVRAIISENYKEFIAGANDTAIGGQDAENFVTSCKQLEETYGRAGSFRYLGELQTPLLINQLYAVKFHRKGADGKNIEHEQLLQLIFGMENNNCKLLGIRFL